MILLDKGTMAATQRQQQNKSNNAKAGIIQFEACQIPLGVNQYINEIQRVSQQSLSQIL